MLGLEGCMSDADYYERRYAGMSREELIAELHWLRDGYGREIIEAEEQLCQALGMTEDPEYGYPSGDHTIVTLATTVRHKMELLRDADSDKVP